MRDLTRQPAARAATSSSATWRATTWRACTPKWWSADGRSGQASCARSTSAGAGCSPRSSLTFARDPPSASSSRSSLSARGSRTAPAVVEIAARQRTLAERYVKEVLLVRAGEQADPPDHRRRCSTASAHALLDGGEAPGVNGDDDETALPAADGHGPAPPDRTASRSWSPTSRPPARRCSRTAGVAGLPHERGRARSPRSTRCARLRVARGADVGDGAERRAHDRRRTTNERQQPDRRTQVALAIGGLLVSLLLASALVARPAARPPTSAAWRSPRTDLVVVLGEGGCRYVEPLAGRRRSAAPRPSCSATGLQRFVHEDDRALLAGVASSGAPGRDQLPRCANAAGEWRHLEARVDRPARRPAPARRRAERARHRPSACASSTS